MTEQIQNQPNNAGKKTFEWDRITAIMAVLIGACALGVSLYTAKLQDAQVRAQTWPYLQMGNSNYEYTYFVANRGVGPARIMDVKLRIDKKEVENFQQALKILSKKDVAPSTTQNYFAKYRVLAANEDLIFLKFNNKEDFSVFYANQDRIKFEVCYCSVLNECYLLNEGAPTEAEYITEVSQCPVGKPGIFR
jgi:hypothetical protein